MTSQGSNDHYGRKPKNLNEEKFSNINGKYSAYLTTLWPLEKQFSSFLK